MRKNIYLEWKSRGVVKDKLELIKKLASVGISEDSIAESLGIALRTFQKMKSDRSDVNLAHESGKNLLKDSMIANIPYSWRIQKDNEMFGTSTKRLQMLIFFLW
jgi:hypothetical protein